MLLVAGVFPMFSAGLPVPSTGWRTEFVDGFLQTQKPSSICFKGRMTGQVGLNPALMISNQRSTKMSSLIVMSQKAPHGEMKSPAKSGHPRRPA